MRIATTVAAIAFAGSIIAQAPAATVQFVKDKGLVLKSDTLFQMVIRFRMQERMGFFSRSGDDLSTAVTDMRTRRARLRFDGFLFTPRLQYKLQLGFSKADMDIGDATSVQYPLRDAQITYALSKQWTIGMGQAKLPGLREQIVASNALELPDRSIVNAAYTLDRDFGAYVNWQRTLGTEVVRFKGAISTGEGRRADLGDDGLCYTGRVEWLPFGAFANDGDFFEGDLEREAKPKLSLAGVYSTNRKARRANGQLGEVFGMGQERTINTSMVDALFKCNGWAISAEYCNRSTEGDPIVVDTLTAHVTSVHEGWGLNAQLGRMMGKRTEVVARYSHVMPGQRVLAVMPQFEEMWLGGNYYVNQHRVKLQAALGYVWRDGVAAIDHKGNIWGMTFQVEVGI